MGVIEHPPIIRLPGVPDHVTYTWLVMIVLIGLALVARGRLALVPRGVQNFLEVILEQFISMIDDVIGHEGRRYLPLQDDISSVAYWYQTQPHAPHPKLPDVDYLEVI